jgi:DNA ligase (NAD+)
MAVELSQNYVDLDKLSRVTIEELQKIEGVGPNIALGIVDWFKPEANKRVLIKLRASGVWPVEKTNIRLAGVQLRFSDQVFVITGTLPGYSRDELKEIIQKNGGKVTDYVSKNTNYLLVGDQPGSKLEKAKQLGVNVIGIDEFNTLLNK